MRTLILLMTAVMLIGVNVCTAASLYDGDFEDDNSWAGTTPTGTLTADDSVAHLWWFGQDTNGWIHQEGGNYAASGNKCAGCLVGYGTSGGLMQLVPITNEINLSLSFQYLLWTGDRGNTTADYAIVGWNEGDVIDLGNLDMTNPGNLDVILSGHLTTPTYPGDNNPGASYAPPYGTTTSITPDTYDYVGIWFQFKLNGGSFYVDDVNLNITPVPEPATIALLGLGGLIIVLRRRGT